MKTIYIALGSNLENPVQQIKTALQELHQLAKTEFICVSKLYTSKPMDLSAQPDFINAVAKLNTQLSASELLRQLQELENKHQRIRNIHWGPRTLDLDILLYGDEIIHTAELTIPHPGIKVRSFVLYPLAEIAPDLQLPSGELVADLVTQLLADKRAAQAWPYQS